MTDAELKAELKELRKGFTADLDYFASEYDSKIKAEAYKDLAEKLKAKKKRFFSEYDGFVECVLAEDIEEILEEMRK